MTNQSSEMAHSRSNRFINQAGVILKNQAVNPNVAAYNEGAKPGRGRRWGISKRLTALKHSAEELGRRPACRETKQSSAQAISLMAA